MRRSRPRSRSLALSVGASLGAAAAALVLSGCGSSGPSNQELAAQLGTYLPARDAAETALARTMVHVSEVASCPAGCNRAARPLIAELSRFSADVAAVKVPTALRPELAAILSATAIEQRHLRNTKGTKTGATWRDNVALSAGHAFAATNRLLVGLGARIHAPNALVAGGIYAAAAGHYFQAETVFWNWLNTNNWNAPATSYLPRAKAYVAALSKFDGAVTTLGATPSLRAPAAALVRATHPIMTTSLQASAEASSVCQTNDAWFQHYSHVYGAAVIAERRLLGSLSLPVETAAGQRFSNQAFAQVAVPSTGCGSVSTGTGTGSGSSGAGSASGSGSSSSGSSSSGSSGGSSAYQQCIAQAEATLQSQGITDPTQLATAAATYCSLG